MPHPLILWLPFAITILSEACVIAALARYARQHIGRLVLVSVVLNLITQPIFAYWLRWALTGQDTMWWNYFLLGEAAVLVCEALVYGIVLKRLRQGLLYAALSNGCSLSLGLLLPL